MIRQLTKSRFPTHVDASEYKRLDDVFVETELEGEFIKVIIKESDKVIWDHKSIAATLIEVPGDIIEILVEKDSPYKIVHEVVALGLTKNKTDRKLIELVEPPYDPSLLPYLNMTPDFIEMVDSEIMIGELGTKNTRSENSISQEFSRKNADLLEKVRGSKLKNDTFCIIVGPTMVYSNLSVSIDQASILCSLFRLGESAFIKATSKFGLPSFEEKTPLSKFISEIEILSKEIKLPSSENPLIISDEMIDFWYSEIPKVEISEISRSLLKECYIESKNYTMKEYDVKDYESDFDKMSSQIELEGSKEKRRKAFKLPFFDGEISGKKKNLKYINNISGSKYLDLINHLSGQFSENDNNEDFGIMENDSDWEQTNSRSFGFIEYVPSESMKIEFSKLGLFGKSNKDKDLRTESKKQISLKSDTSLLHDFVLKTTLLDEEDEDECLKECFSSFDKISLETLSQYEERRVKEDLLKFDLSFRRTRLGKICCLYDLIYQELNYKIAKISSKTGFYLNRVSDTNWFVICKPTGTHLFYCLFRLNEGKEMDCNPLFDEPVVNNPDITVFPWRSTDKDRISTMLNIYENMLVLYCDILSHYLYQSHEVQPRSKLIFTFLMNCDNKQVTADTLYLWREMLMKFCSGDKFSRPGILFSKMPKVRSLFGCYILQRMLIVGKRMIVDRPYRFDRSEEDGGNEDVIVNADCFENLLDLVTGLKEMHFENAMYTSYLACYHSYATMSQMAANFKVVEKIVDYELKLRDARGSSMGRDSNWGDVRDHEFNLRLSLLGGLMKRKLLRDIYTDSLDIFLYRTLKLSMEKSFLEFGTFKASLERVTDEYHRPMMKPKTYKALETLKAQFSIFDKCIDSPYEDLRKLFSFLDEEVHAKVDKKMDQAKGLREILTMDMRSRFFLNIIERFMEKVNRESPSEVLSKGEQKLKIIKTIDEAVYELSEEGYDLFVIDQVIDHSKWCQMFVMNKFATHLAPLLPRSIFRIFCAILNKVTRKKIFLNKDFLSKISSLDEIYSESISELRDQFNGKSDSSDLIGEMQTSLRNMSNMGQGWLQNLSGSDGDVDMQICASVMEMWVQSLKNRGKIPDDTRVFNFRISSSDDQRQRKILKIRKGYSNIANNYLRLVGVLPQVISKHTCKKMSVEKTELFSMNLLGEFNQFFTSANMNFVGTCKFSRSSVEIPVTTSLNDRFFNFSNTRRNMIENGVDNFTTLIAQLMQMRTHYRSLGLGVDKLFPKYMNRILKYQSPYFGFFPWERSSAIGMFGNDIARYDNINTSLESRFVLSKLLSNLDLRMGARGELGPSISFRLTKKDKFKNFLKKFDYNPEYFRTRPQIIYNGAEERMDTWQLINAKAYLAEAELAFVFDSTSKVFASSFLFLREPVIKFSMLSGKSRVPKRCNIFGLIDYLTDGYKEIPLEHVLPAFPNASLYETIRTMLPNTESAFSFPHTDFARRKSTFHFSNVIGGMEIPLIDCVKQIWFGKSSGHNSKLTRDSFLAYKSFYPWLRDTHEQTMSNGLFDFENPFQLKSTLESIRQRDLRFSIVSPIKQSTLEKMLRSFSKYNYKRGHILQDVKVTPFLISKDSDMHRVARIINGPFTFEEKLMAISDLDLSTYRPEFDSNMSRRRLYSLWLLNESKHREIEKSLIINSLIQAGKEYIPYYKVPQKKQKDGSYKGNMILDLIFENNNIQIEFVSDKLKVVCSGSLFLNSKSQLVYDLLIRMGFADYQRQDGLRLTSSGILERSKLGGFPIEIRKTFLNYGTSTARLDFDFDISSNGRVNIKILTESEKFNFDHWFFINDWYIAGLPKENAKGYEEKWISNEPYNIKDLEELISKHLTWAKESYKSLMDSVVLPSSMLRDRLKQEFVEMDFDLDLLDITQLNKVHDMSVLDEFIKEAGIIEALTDANIDKLELEDFGLDLEDLDVNDFEYFTEIKTHKFNNKVFEILNKELAYMNIFELYAADYRVLISSTDPYFSIFCKLTDYNERPLLEKMRARLDSITEEQNEHLELGKDKIVVRYNGKLFEKGLEPSFELFKDSILFQEDKLLPINGVFIDINGKTEQLKLKRFGKYELLNQFVDYIMDKIGIPKEQGIKLTVERRSGQFEYSKEELGLSEKVKRYWGRFDRYKDDFVFSSELGEFFVENPVKKD